MNVPQMLIYFGSAIAVAYWIATQYIGGDIHDRVTDGVGDA